MLQPGDHVHHYQVEAYVGGGGMAHVYRVRHAILGHTLALKVLDARWVGDTEMRKRFLAEGRIQALVRHPGIVMVTDAVVDAGRGLAGLVMEFVEGPTLADVIHRLEGPPAAELVHALVEPVLAAMHHVHGEGVVHRDLKPGNILLSRDAAGDWHPRVVDFGIAHVAEAARITRVSMPDGERRMGTPAFMAPEQLRGAPPDPRQDVWALGVVLYELATGGEHPFEVSDVAETERRVLTASPVDPRTHNPALDPAIARTIDAALRADPALRAPTCGALLDLLRTQPLPRAEPIARATRAELVEGQGSTGVRFCLPIDRPATLGSAGASDLVLAAGQVEPLHAVVKHGPLGWVIEDRSVGGTRVNGARVRTAQLADGDLIRVGHHALRFRAVRNGVAQANLTPVPRMEPARTGWHLVFDPPGHPSRTVDLSPGDVVFGSDAGCDVVLSGLAPRHARVRLLGRDLTVEDLEGAGLRIDGQRATFRRLRGGEELDLGPVRVTVHRG